MTSEQVVAKFLRITETMTPGDLVVIERDQLRQLCLEAQQAPDLRERVIRVNERLEEERADHD